MNDLSGISQRPTADANNAPMSHEVKALKLVGSRPFHAKAATVIPVNPINVGISREENIRNAAI
ncbi:hypothetical protein [Stenotrophomonas sp.]|uniref:hypothetical protein n=1 Tax=Stenotrophomonas sp. TaxID=69392 RepID=UPI0028A5C683|nr:hypothetical protein [Stenotrophomonas sp.]